MARKSRYTDPVQADVPEQAAYQAAQYGRLSVEDGDDIERNSIGNQRKIAAHYAMGRDDIVIVEHYFDNGYSGMNYDRPDFQRMMEDVERGKINCIIVKDISRFGREFVSTSEYVERILPNMGVRLICINDGYDSIREEADTDLLMLPLKMVMNDSYVRDISRKIRSGISAKMNSGEFLPAAGSIPYGYLRNVKENTYDIDSEAADVVKRIFTMRADGRAFNEIARTLNADGVPSPGRLRYERGLTKSEKYRDALWLPKTIRKIATDRVYLGYRIHGKIKRDKIGRNKTQRPEESWQIIENAHPAIVERELFEKIQRINQEELAKRERYGACNEVTVDHRSLFRGKVVCGECGHLLTAAKGCARPGAKSGSRVFFDCSTYKKSNHTQCSSHYIRQETLFHAIQHTLDQQVRIAVDFGKMLADVQKMPTIKAAKSAQTRKQVSLRVKRQNIENKLEQLLHDLTTGLITRDEYEYIKRRYNEQYAQIQSEEIALRETMKVAEMQLRSAEQWLAEVKRYQKIPVIDRPMIDLLIREIKVFQDRSVKIELNYADPCQPLYAYMDLYTEERHAV